MHGAIKRLNRVIAKVIRNQDDLDVNLMSAQWSVDEQTRDKDNVDTISQSLRFAQWPIEERVTDSLIPAQCYVTKFSDEAQCVVVGGSDADVPSLTWKKTVKMPVLNFTAGCHITHVAPERVWVSDMKGHLFLMDYEGKVLVTIKTRSGHGFHTVNRKGALLYTDAESKQVYKVRFKRKRLGVKVSSVHKKPLLTTSDWTPLCIHASRHNGDLFVGMCNEIRARVTRYDSSGRELQEMELDNEDTPLYELPQFITENFNFDVITSDRTGIVAVDYSGKRRWTYSGHGISTSGLSKTGSGFLPAGICCDKLLNIAVYDVFDNRVHLLDKDGNYLSRLLVLGNAWIPQGLCFDDENNLYCGDRSKISVFKYEYLR